MSDELIFFEFLECDLADNASRRNRRLEMRRQNDPFQLSDLEFIRQYRLSKKLTIDLCEEIRPLMREQLKSTDIDVETKVLTALSFYAFGSYQRPIGNIGVHSMAQQTVSSALAQVTACLNSEEMRRKYIVFPQTLDERNETKRLFNTKFGFPGVLGCIDCTQIPIIRPTDHEERYYCRKQYHSLNVQLICDANMQITSVDASFGGATHDSFIWNCHPLKIFFESLNETTWLLGDSGYPLRRYMMTPIIDAADNTPESHYTYIHVRTRNIIERTIGLLKARFRCILGHRVLHYTPEVAGSIINACCVLHNICNKVNVPLPNLEIPNANEQPTVELINDFDSSTDDTHRNNPELGLGISSRQRLVQRLWEARGSSS